ncbi:hypothetical protein B0H65DRAFT_52995 [Neurospora tetraspora]|uniref:Uncharacterized protein n=1 Tax=Neurospora tetraspora TaxID=94610 RepID=A0AAE0JQQ7_9PEZI|nr:hypothetical protein B0H65DRAFT_52995 [Neurospora tetraspora]
MIPDFVTIRLLVEWVLLSWRARGLFHSRPPSPLDFFMSDDGNRDFRYQNALTGVCSAALIYLSQIPKTHKSHPHRHCQLHCWSRTTSLNAQFFSADSTARSDHTMICAIAICYSTYAILTCPLYTVSSLRFQKLKIGRMHSKGVWRRRRRARRGKSPHVMSPWQLNHSRSGKGSKRKSRDAISQDCGGQGMQLRGRPWRTPVPED